MMSHFVVTTDSSRKEGSSQKHDEKQQLVGRLLDAVKQCQVRFGGKTELATDKDSRAIVMCSAWESVMIHGLRKPSGALSTLRQVTEKAGLSRVSDVLQTLNGNDMSNVSFWPALASVLSSHEQQRFNSLRNIRTEAGRVRSWLRSALNEKSLERYLHMLLSQEELLLKLYEDWAIMRDEEITATLPNMAAGLGSILFALPVDCAELNSQGFGTGEASPVAVRRQPEQPDPSPVRPNNISEEKSEKGKRRKPKPAKIVSFDDTNSDRKPTSDRIRKHKKSSSYDYSKANFSTKAVEIPISSVVDHSADAMLESGSVISVQSNNSIESIGSLATGTVCDEDLLPVMSHDDRDSLSTTSDKSIELPSYSDDYVTTAARALRATQQAVTATSELVDEKINTDTPSDEMGELQLKQALLALSSRKNTVEAENRSLLEDVTSERRLVAALQEELKTAREHHSVIIKQLDSDKQAHVRERELLKHQLRKYVSAVQMLRAGTTDDDQLESTGIRLDKSESVVAPSRLGPDYGKEAAEFEKKLVQVAEMHGELLEFNEILQRQLRSRELEAESLRQQLVSLRGPLPQSSIPEENSSDVDGPVLMSLISLWIPSAFLRGSGSSDAHHVYQVYIKIGDEEWNVYRRYTQFRDFHKSMQKRYPIISTLDFPPKKAVGRKDSRLVEKRRKKLQTYLRDALSRVAEYIPELTSPTQRILTDALPFFRAESETQSATNTGNSRSGRRSLGKSQSTPHLREQTPGTL